MIAPLFFAQIRVFDKSIHFLLIFFLFLGCQRATISLDRFGKVALRSFDDQLHCMFSRNFVVIPVHPSAIVVRIRSQFIRNHAAHEGSRIFGRIRR